MLLVLSRILDPAPLSSSSLEVIPAAYFDSLWLSIPAKRNSSIDGLIQHSNLCHRTGFVREESPLAGNLLNNKEVGQHSPISGGAPRRELSSSCNASMRSAFWLAQSDAG